MKFDFDAIFYYVFDLDRAVRFYNDVLGFRLVSRDTVARFDVGGVLFELVPTRDSSRLQGKGNGRLCLKVVDIHAAVSLLRARGVSTDEPEEKDNGVLASFHDLDGNEMCLWQYMSHQVSGIARLSST